MIQRAVYTINTTDTSAIDEGAAKDEITEPSAKYKAFLSNDVSDERILVVSSITNIKSE